MTNPLEDGLMTQDYKHPITPPPELVQQWTDNIYGGPGVVTASDDICLAKLAAQWGADQELEACIELLVQSEGNDAREFLRAARRPKPPNLKEQAIQALKLFTPFIESADKREEAGTIRRALEQLPDNE